MELGRFESQLVEAATSQAIESAKSQEAAKSHATETAKSSSTQNLLDGNRQDFITGESSHGIDLHNRQSGEERRVRNSESRLERELVESQENLQEQALRDNYQQDNPSTNTHHRITNLNKGKEPAQHYQQPAISNTRTPGAKEIVHPLQITGNQGNPTPISDGNLNVLERMNLKAARNQNYQSNYPKISSNFDRINNRNMFNKTDPPLVNVDKLNKKDQPQEPAPYIVIQTYADRLRFNQSKKGVTITLTAPEITTKQGFPAVLYVKDEVVKELASTCKYTLIGKFIYTMPRVELIRKNFILQTQLSSGVKIATLDMYTLTLIMNLTTTWYGPNKG